MQITVLVLYPEFSFFFVKQTEISSLNVEISFSGRCYYLIGFPIFHITHAL